MFLSTPPSRVATLISFAVAVVNRVSIHATLAGGDNRNTIFSIVWSLVSIHATLAGGDLVKECSHNPSLRFLSTPPSRVATHRPRLHLGIRRFSIHATLAGGDKPPQKRNAAWRNFSIHATLAGGDRKILLHLLTN